MTVIGYGFSFGNDENFLKYVLVMFAQHLRIY